MTSEPCSCVCLANDFAVIGTDKFYRLTLEHPNITGMFISEFCVCINLILINM
jgi:hypothetical protein